ncbi:MAG TPA: aldo/keto reductase [Phycisphaerae bacterium]|nr:aldo/keto reductase [Phycisphaerae bacterium]HUU21003.1 aldo/keto reductase [Phycisphaerae bacterium]
MSDKAGMKSVRIDPVDKDLSIVGLGCWSYGGEWGPQDDADSLDALRTALEVGFTHIDTAEAYGRGHSEELVGRAIAGRRDEVFVATKGFPCWGDLSRACYALKIDESLRRLGTDFIDLYYIHWPMTGRDMRPPMEAIVAAQEAGKVGAVGVSNFTVEEMEQVAEVGRIDAHQLCYNLFWRQMERDVIPYCIEHGIAVVTWSTLAEGILTGKFPREPKFPEGDHRRRGLLFEPEVWPHVHKGVERLKALAAEADVPLAHLAVQWVTRRPGITSVLVGSRNAEQVRRNAEAMASEVPDETFEKITEIGDAVWEKVPEAVNVLRWHP